MVFLSDSAAATKRLAEKIAKELKGGEVITLSGGLGSGKTVFCKGLAKGLNIKSTVTSPTFTIFNLYHGKFRLMHCDAYRLSGIDDAESVGLTDYLGQADCISVIEWPENIAELIKNHQAINVEIKFLTENKREITVC